MATTDAVLSIDFHISRKAVRALPGDQQGDRRDGDRDDGGEHRRGDAVEQLPAHAASRCLAVLGQCAGHVAAEVGLAHRRRVEVGDDPAAQHHEQPVGEPISSSRSAENSVARPAARASRDVPDHGLGADVDAAVGGRR